MQYFSEFMKRHNPSVGRAGNAHSMMTRSRKRSAPVDDDSHETANVNVANGLFVSQKHSLIPSYETLIKEKLCGKILSLNFDDTKHAVEVTSGKIG